MKKMNDTENIINFEISDDISASDFYKSINVSSRILRRLIREKNLKINDGPSRKDMLLSKGDIVSFYFQDEENNVTPENIPLDILYEDLDIIAMNKPSGIVVHQTKSHQSNTLSNAVSWYFRENNIRKKIRFINRLDRDTSGVLLVAKNPFAHQQLALELQDESIEKKYYAVVDGIVNDDEGMIDLPINIAGDNIIREVSDDGKPSVTFYKVIDRFKSATLLDVRILTGRTHQIRVHMKSIGHPIIGDSLYGDASELISRQALHSYYLKFKTIRTKRVVEITAPMQDDLHNLLQLL